MEKIQLNLLFRKTEEYHKNSLKLLFQQFYLPMSSSDDVNKEWASNLSESTFNKLRLHLSWTMGINTFVWDRHNVGEQTLITLKKLGVLQSLIQKTSPVDYDYILC